MLLYKKIFISLLCLPYRQCKLSGKILGRIRCILPNHSQKARGFWEETSELFIPKCRGFMLKVPKFYAQSAVLFCFFSELYRSKYGVLPSKVRNFSVQCTGLFRTKCRMLRNTSSSLQNFFSDFLLHILHNHGEKHSVYWAFPRVGWCVGCPETCRIILHKVLFWAPKSEKQRTIKPVFVTKTAGFTK